MNVAQEVVEESGIGDRTDPGIGGPADDFCRDEASQCLECGQIVHVFHELHKEPCHKVWQNEPIRQLAQQSSRRIHYSTLEIETY
jgi:hypothetical protein